jgi:CubicO group peptidase (beta-lactamase class C family)
MRKFILLISSGIISLVAYSQNPNPNTALDNSILQIMEEEKLPGVSTLIVKGGEIIWNQSYGFADIENEVNVTDSTIFMLASISKLFTGTSILKLVEEGLIQLDDPINNYLPFQIQIPNYENIPITFRHLLTHTSSIQDGQALDNYYSIGDPTITLEACIERYFSPSGSDYNPTDNFHNSAPGTVYDYSNIATALAGYLVEVISETPFDQFCKTKLFDEICMENTSWYLSNYDTLQVARPYQFQNGSYVPYTHYGFADYPDGQLRSNVNDLAAFMLAFLNNGTLSNNVLLSSESVSEMLSTQVPTLDNTQGLNWYQEILYGPNGEVTVWGHNGGESGVSTDLYLDLNTGIGLVVLSNGEGDCLSICDELYTYATSVIPSGLGFNACISNSIPKINSEANKTEVIPNPIIDSGIIKFSNPNQQEVELILMNSLGQVVKVIQAENPDFIRINKNQLEKGIYFYSIINSENLIIGLGKVEFE